MSTGSIGDQLLEAELKAELAANYAIVAMAALLVYGYLLSLDSEVKYIWGSKLSFMTLIYGVLRYGGMLWLVSIIAIDLNVPLSNRTCLAMNAIGDVTETVLLFFLQGVMSLRVYLLYNKSKRCLVLISICFIGAQGATIASSLYILTNGSVSEVEGNILGFDSCLASVAQSLLWAYSLQSAPTTGFEVLICVAVLIYMAKHITFTDWRAPTILVGNMVTIIIRDNLIYLFIAFSSLLIGSISQDPTLNTYESPEYLVVMNVLGSILYSMVGPWMMLSLRKHARNASGSQSELSEGTGIRFGNVDGQQGGTRSDGEVGTV